MGKKDPRVDASIGNAAEFAKPILRALRAVVHEACPDCEETMKWNFPHFTYKGLLASMASFNEHCAFGYWKGSLVVGEQAGSKGAMGHLGRITAIADLPSKATLVKWTKRAAELNDNGVTVKRHRRAEEAAARTCRPGGGAREEPESADGLRGVQPEQAARLRRVADRSEVRRHAQ